MKPASICNALITTVLVVACSAGFRVIKGSVIIRTPTEARIDLGSEDGIQVGDTLTVWREERREGTSTRTVRVGTVRVASMLDREHATVEVLTGSLRERDRVEKLVYVR